MNLQDFRKILDRALQLDGKAIAELINCVREGICFPKDERTASFICTYLFEHFYLGDDWKEWQNVDSNPNISELLDSFDNGDRISMSSLFQSIEYKSEYNKKPLSIIPYYRLREEIDKAWELALKEPERRAKEEAERRTKEEAERKAKEEAERRAKEEAERRAKEEAERRAKEEAERRAKEEAERRAKEEVERRAKEEAERKAKEEAERKAKEEAERKAKEEAKRTEYKKFIENIKTIAQKDISDLKASFIFVKGGTFLSFRGGTHPENVGDFYITKYEVNEFILNCCGFNHNNVAIDEHSKEHFECIMSSVLGMFVHFPTLVQLEYALRGGKDINNAKSCCGNLLPSIKFDTSIPVCFSDNVFTRRKDTTSELSCCWNYKHSRHTGFSIYLTLETYSKEWATQLVEKTGEIVKDEVGTKDKEIGHISIGKTNMSYGNVIEEFVNTTKECEYKEGLIFGKKKTITYVTSPITRRIWNAVVNKQSEQDFDDDELVSRKELGKFIEELNTYFSDKMVFEYTFKNIYANAHLQVHEKLDKDACFVYIKEDNR